VSITYALMLNLNYFDGVLAKVKNRIARLRFIELEYESRDIFFEYIGWV